MLFFRLTFGRIIFKAVMINHLLLIEALENNSGTKKPVIPAYFSVFRAAA
jgi:hypothetical protein